MDMQAIAGHVIEIVLIVFGPILSILAAWALKKLANKLHIDASLIQDQQVYAVVNKAVSFAEEFAQKNTGTTGNQKADMAFKFATEILENETVNEYGIDPLRKLIEAAVQDNRNATAAAVPEAGK